MTGFGCSHIVAVRMSKAGYKPSLRRAAATLKFEKGGELPLQFARLRFSVLSCAIRDKNLSFADEMIFPTAEFKRGCNGLSVFQHAA